MSTKPRTLYYNIEDSCLYEDQPSYGVGYETITTSLDEGFLLLVSYTTYDSFDSYDGVNYEAVDLYDSFDKAELAAKTIAKEVFNFMGDKYPEITSSNVLNNEGKRAYYPSGWGTSVKKVEIKKVKIEEPTSWTYS